MINNSIKPIETVYNGYRFRSRLQAHDDLITSNGYVWYGKIGSAIADSAVEMVLDKHKQSSVDETAI